MFREAFESETPTNAKRVPTFESMKAILYRDRRKRRPALPQHRRDIVLEGERAMTLNNEQFLLAEDGDMTTNFSFSTHLFMKREREREEGGKDAEIRSYGLNATA